MCSAGLALTLLCPAVAFAIFFIRRGTKDAGGHWEGNSGGSSGSGPVCMVGAGSSTGFELANFSSWVWEADSSWLLHTSFIPLSYSLRRAWVPGEIFHRAVTDALSILHSVCLLACNLLAEASGRRDSYFWWFSYSPASWRSWIIGGLLWKHCLFSSVVQR